MVTTMTPYPTRPVGLYNSLAPVRSEPPCTQTITGRLRAWVLLALAGVNTFRYRQSSDVLATPNADDGCGQCGAKLVAARTLCQGAGGFGGCQRSAPTGGAAYGMPRYSSVAATAFPRTAPSAVVTTRPPLLTALPADVRPGLAVEPAVAVALVHAAAVISTAATAAPLVSLVRTRCLAGIARIAASASSRLEKSD